MKYTSFALQSILVTFLLLARSAAGVDGSSSELTLTEQTIQAIRNCMARSPAQWPVEWNKEYVETIRSVVELHRDILQFSLRLEVLHKGFQTCWDDFTKNKERSLFEVYRTRSAAVDTIRRVHWLWTSGVIWIMSRSWPEGPVQRIAYRNFCAGIAHKP